MANKNRSEVNHATIVHMNAMRNFRAPAPATARRESLFDWYIRNNPGLQPINKQHWYRGFIDDMLKRGHSSEEINAMLHG